MREAFKDFQNEYFGDDVSMEFKNFNVVHIVAIAALLFSIILVMLFFPTRKAVLVCFCTAAVALFTLYEGNRTGNYFACSMVMSCVINLLFFPMIFFEYGKINSGIAIYFILGLLYNVVLMPPIRAFIMCGIDFVTYFIIIDVGANIFPDTRLTGETIYDYLNIAIGIILTSISCGLVIKYKVHLYNNVQNNLEKIHEEAMETYVAKDIFLINMSHEIRTPMNAIVGTVDLLLDQDVNDHVRECVYNILNSCNALLSLTDEVMDISKSTTSEIEIHNHKYDVSDMLMEIINMMAVRLMDSDIEFKVDIDNQLPLNLYGDGSRLKQVFNNLLSNAVKYTKEGSITLRVGCEYLSDTEVMIKGEVEDTGIGIKEDAVPGLFDVYKRVQDSKHNVEKIEGTGLGLPICKDIVEKMYGNIQVESVYNQGSRFSFEVLQTVESGKRIVELEAANRFKALIYTSKSDETEQIKNILDLLNVSNTIIEDDEKFEKSLNVCLYNYIFISADYYKANESVLEKKLTRERIVIVADLNESVTAEKAGYVLSRPIHLLNVSSVLLNKDSSYSRAVIKKGGFECPEATILVVDDNLTNLNVASGLLKKYNANVLTALSGKECLNIINSEHIDLIFLDYMMPEMNGIDTLNAIRELNNPEFDKIPVVALTANVVNGAREMFMDAGFTDYISKPIEVEKMERALRKLLRKELLINKNS